MKKKDLLISFWAVLAVVVALFIWSVLAKKNIEKMSEQFEQEYRPLAKQMNNVITNDGKAQEVIQYQTLSNLVQSFQSRKETLSGLQAKIANGEGVGFWYPSVRQEEADTCKAKYDGMSRLIKTVTPAVNLLQPVTQEIQAVLSASNNSRQLAVSILARDKDIFDFQERLADLKKKMPPLYKKTKELEISLGISLLTGSSDDFRKSMVRSMLVSLKDEAGRLHGRIVATSEARKSLEGYKAKVNDLFASNSNLLGNIQYISDNLRPAIVFAYEKTQPMRNFFQQADEPIFGGGFGGAIASLFSRGGSGEKLSALSLAKGIDPSISLTVDVMQGICEEIESVYRVSSDLNKITQPMMIALSEYQGLSSRANLLRLVETVKPAAAYYDSNKGFFDPVLNKIEEGRQSIQRLYSVADSIRIPGAGNLIRQGAAIGENLISAAESPFLQGRRTIIDLVDSLGQVQSFEDNYINDINMLTKEKFVSKSFSFQKETPVEE